MFRAKNVQCSCSLTPRNCLSTALYIRTPFTHFKAQIDSICQILNIVIKMTVNYMPTKLTTNIHHLRSHMQWQTIQYTTIDIHTPAHAFHSISICLITNGLVTSNTTPSSSIKMILISSPMRLHFSMVSLCFFLSSHSVVIFGVCSLHVHPRAIYLLKSMKSNVYQH